MDITSNAIAEIHPGDVESTSVSAFDNYRSIPEDGSGTFELSL